MYQYRLGLLLQISNNFAKMTNSPCDEVSMTKSPNDEVTGKRS